MNKERLTIDEVFGILSPSSDEIEISRTPDLGKISDPNWSSTIKKFSLGLQNDKETTLSNMIAKKINKDETYGLSYFLDHMRISQELIFKFMLDIIDRLIAKEKK